MTTISVPLEVRDSFIFECQVKVTVRVFVFIKDLYCMIKETVPIEFDYINELVSLYTRFFYMFIYTRVFMDVFRGTKTVSIRILK